MREILFRGKRLDNGEWVKGFITAACDCAGRLYFIEQPAQDLDDCNHSYEVDFTTIGQYTGMLDKNGIKIFEGDIVDFSDRSDGDGYGVVRYDETETEFEIEYDNICKSLGRHYYPKDIEVIGNIYDNPELLKGALE